MTSALRYDRVAYRYAVDRAAVRDVSLAIAPGERVALVGANGAGKTTLLLLATGLIAPASGRVEVEGLVVGPRTVREVRRRLALVFADPDDQLFCPTVLDEVAFAPRQRGEPEGRCVARAHEALAAVGLEGYDAREPLDLSLGEKKRLAIAAALATEARVLLLDEPTSGLDPRARRRFLELLGRLDAAVVFATHDLESALALGTRVVLLDGGAVAADGPADQVLRDTGLLERHGL
jgi:cobalt/nickel transport system ATP-binding protein